MQHIAVDFEVFKELVARRPSEAVSENDVIRELLGLPATKGRRVSEAVSGVSNTLKSAPVSGFQSRDLFLPDGSKLRAGYKGRVYNAEIRDGEWVDERGEIHSSPSAAAKRITETNVNGLRFWEARFPGESAWRRLADLSGSS